MTKALRSMLAIALAFVSLGSTAAIADAEPTQPAQSRPTAWVRPRIEPGVFEDTKGLQFSSAQDRFTYKVDAVLGAGVLTVQTRDCCKEGDVWVVFVQEGFRRRVRLTKGTGSGSTTEYSGTVTVAGWTRGLVTVTYGGGTDIFPAEMEVKFSFSSWNRSRLPNLGMKVTRLDTP